MGTSYFDSEGSATFLFDNVPINAVKRARFKDKLGTIHTLLKMVYNSVTYDFTKTAKNGAVIFADNYSGWEFIAPDNRLDFDGYTNMTMGDALKSMRAALVQDPIPAWDKFASWLDGYSDYLKNFAGQCTTFIWPINGSGQYINGINFTKMTGGSFIDFLDVLIDALDGYDIGMSNYKTSDTSFACILTLSNENGHLIDMTFKFRE